MPLRAAIAVPLLLAAACGPSEERLSDIALHRSIERLRGETGSSLQDRRVMLVDVERHDARTAVAREAKQACGRAYRELLDAEDALVAAEAEVKAAPAGGALPVSALLDLANAEKLLAAAREAMPACDTAAARLAIAAR